MTLTRGIGHQRWLAAGLIVLLMVSAVFLLRPAESGGDAAPPPATEAVATPERSVTSSGQGNPSAASIEVKVPAQPTDGALPRTQDHRLLAVAAAQGIYTWDSRLSSYSEVYARVRSWWELLPDGSNPLSVLVREFEATGVTAGSFAVLAEQSSRRSGSAQGVRCDLELAKVQEYPAPWDGLHVCTVTLQVVDDSSNSQSEYAAPITVMTNCPPAATAPIGRCAMVGFYATPERIVY
ncbi:hypothetical protein QFZ35_003185 [Arthrobacter ulcerisalmonis]|nr:hypothetical protein [Arthrobacter ulcerisalmonis]